MSFVRNLYLKHFLVCAENNIPLATRNYLPAQAAYKPLGSALKKYWTTPKYRDAFPKLAKCAETLWKWPTTSTMIERGFSEVSAHFTKQRNRIHTETLCHIHQNNNTSVTFMKKLKTACDAYNIKTD